MDKALLAALVEARATIAAAHTAEPGEAAVARRLQRELDEAIARLEGRPDKDLVSIVCHDLKDPLASIVMGSGFLRKTIAAEEGPARRVVDAIARSAERMNHLVGDFHDLAKLESGMLTVEIVACDLVAVVHGALRPLEAVARERGIGLAFESAGNALLARCDRARVSQIVVKLVGNAVRFTSAGGSVVVRVERDDGRARVVVRDTGRGIAAERLARVFDRAFNARQTPRDGPGLGLAIARGLALLQGGDVEAKSEAGAGSTFTLVLPAA